MTDGINKILSLDREDMSETERQLFLKDLKRVAEEYFECGERLDLEIVRADGGFTVSVLFTARRVKSVKKPV